MRLTHRLDVHVPLDVGAQRRLDLRFVNCPSPLTRHHACVVYWLIKHMLHARDKITPMVHPGRMPKCAVRSSRGHFVKGLFEHNLIRPRNDWPLAEPIMSGCHRLVQ